MRGEIAADILAAAVVNLHLTRRISADCSESHDCMEDFEYQWLPSVPNQFASEVWRFSEMRRSGNGY